MRKILIRTVIVVMLGLLNGCTRHYIDVPPPPGPKAENWWSKTVDELDLDFLAVLCEVSDAHRRAGTTAIYEEYMGVHVSLTPYTSLHLFQLPVPLPEPTIGRIKARLVAHILTDKSPTYRDFSGIHARYSGGVGHWKGRQGCSDEMAETVWKEAERKFELRKSALSKDKLECTKHSPQSQ